MREKLLSIIQKGEIVLDPKLLNSFLLEENGALPAG
jgi:hypothetical protein